ncbi:MAG: RNA-directed DNA polymerase, partial [Gammaproteobacteria bacterium]|nr:RNA-directed DNA polymerase [Gammaproteobacteria bacterium]
MSHYTTSIEGTYQVLKLEGTTEGTVNPQQMTAEDIEELEISSTKYIWIPPYASGVAQVTVNGMKPETDYLFERTEKELTHYDVTVPATVQKRQSDGYVMVIYNAQPHPISIPKGTRMGRATECEVLERECHDTTNLVTWKTQEQIDEHWNRIEPQIRFGTSDPKMETARQRCLAVTKRYHDCFADGVRELGEANDTEFGFELLEKPPKQYARRLPFPLQEPVMQQLMDNVETGIMRHSDGSEYASPIVPVKKKNGEIRIASDFRMLNARIKHSATPLPRIDDLYNAIGAIKPKYFIKLDMASGYHQIRMTKEAAEMSAVVCGPYHLEWVRMPFGIATSPG